MKFAFHAVAAAALLATTASAFAASPTALGTIDNTSAVFGNPAPSTPFFFDTYTFTLANPGTVFGGSFSFGITGFTAVLQNASFATVGTDTNPGDGFSFSGLAAGAYAISFLGMASTPAAYGGVLSSVTAPVPEPQSYALMLAGLGIVGFVMARRRPQG